jgi:hypothetical protein
VHGRSFARATSPVPLPRYLEASKTRLSGPRATAREAAQARRVLVYVFDTCLRLLHPYMPFVTETLWQQLPTDPNHGKGVNHTHTRTRMPYLRRLVGASLRFLSLSLSLSLRSFVPIPSCRKALLFWILPLLLLVYLFFLLLFLFLLLDSVFILRSVAPPFLASQASR